MELTRQALKGFRRVIVEKKAIGPLYLHYLALPPSGGVHQSTLPMTLGTAAWAATLTDKSLISEMGILCVA